MLSFVDRAILISAATLMPILGVTWVFGLLAINEETEVFAWIFTILNAFQVCYFWLGGSTLLIILYI